MKIRVKSKVATIVPLNHLDLIKDDDYFMALSYVASNQDYVDFFRARSDEGKYVILDNSAIEMGEPEEFDSYFHKARSMSVSGIMLPDFFEDPEATLEKARLILEDYHRGITTEVMDVMVRPQGETPSIWLENAQDLYRLCIQVGLLPVIGITYRIAPIFDGFREPAVSMLALSESLYSVDIHLLGAAVDPRVEVKPLLKHPRVRGVDSSYPTIYAQHGIELTSGMLGDDRPDRNIDFVNDLYDERLLRGNIEVWKRAVELQNA